MECWAIARCVRFGSLTALGDLATPWAARSWPVQLAHLGKPDATIVPLTVCFRIPRAVLALSDRLLDHLDTDVPRARSLRLAAPCASAARRPRRPACARPSTRPVSPLPPGSPSSPPLSKGLEYDHVVAVEPAAIAEAEPRGLNRLYVVLTRAVSRLDVVHARALPW